MELRETEAVRMLHHHDGGVGNVQTDLHHRGRHQNPDLSVAQGLHLRILLLAPEAAVGQTHAVGREHFPELSDHFFGGAQVQLVRFLDQRNHHVGLPAPGPAPASGDHTPGFRSGSVRRTVLTGRRPGGSSSSTERSRSP